jgi:hypothetical protein
MTYEQELSNEVTQSGDLKVVSMRELRDGFEYKRLGPNVTTTISRALDGVGLSHAPADLPDDQNEDVLVFRRGKPVGSIVNAVLNPSAGGAEALRSLVQSDASEVLEKIKALVC